MMEGARGLREVIIVYQPQIHHLKQLKISGDPQPVYASASEGIHCNNWGHSKHPSGFYENIEDRAN